MFRNRLALALSIVLASSAPVLYSPVVKANPPRSFTFPIGQPVTLNAGDSALITVVLTTSDPNEDGEGEGVVLSGAAGSVACPMTVLDYFVPHVLQCGPVPFGMQLTLTSSYIRGPDGDEVAVGSAQVNTPEAAKKSQQTTDALEQMAHADDALANTYETWLYLCTQSVPGLLFCKYVIPNSVNFERLAAFERANGYTLAAIAADPPDPNYTQIFQPVTQYYPPLVLGTGAPQNVSDDLNALYSNYQQRAGLLFAIYTSLNRASGALQAGMTDWQNAQIAAANQYGQQVAQVMKLEPGLTATLQRDIAAAGISVPTATSSDAFTVDQGILTNGLPSEEQAVLTNVGFSSSDIQQMTNLGFVQSTTEVAALLSSSDGSSAWDNSARNALILSAAGAFQPAPSVMTSANPQTFVPPQLATKVPVTISGAVTDIAPFGGASVGTYTGAYTVTDQYGQYQPQGSVSIDSSGNYSFVLLLPATLSNQYPDGRLYTITVAAEDSTGNYGSGSTKVTVVPQIKSGG